MDVMDGLIEKRVFVILKTGRKYCGVVKTIDNQMVSLIDKFNELVIFDVSEISSIEEQKEIGRWKMILLKQWKK